MTKGANGSGKPGNAKIEALLALRKKIVSAAKPDAESLPDASVVDLVEAYPQLHLVMMAHLVDDGPEEGATITLWGKSEGLGGVLNVKPFGVRAFIDAQSLQEWLQTAEGMLSDPDTKWHRSGAKQKAKRRSGKPGRSWS